ncbi:MAG: hypothetical protein ACTSP3_05035 [Candidatus Heimdallarchaeaceae archaeon]
MKTRVMGILIVFFFLVNCSQPSAYKLNVQVKTHVIQSFTETNEIKANSTTQINATIIELFDNISIPENLNQSKYFLDFIDGLRVFYGFDELGNYGNFVLTAGDSFVNSFTSQPYLNFTEYRYYLGLIYNCFFLKENGTIFKGNYVDTIVYPINFTWIEGLSLSIASVIADDLLFHVSNYFWSGFTQYSMWNYTHGDIITECVYFNRTQYDLWGNITQIYESAILLDINLTSGVLSRLTVDFYHNQDLKYKVIIEYSEPYYNTGFDYIKIDFPEEITEGELFYVNVEVFDTAGAYFEVLYRLKGDDKWLYLYETYYDNYPFNSSYTHSAKYLMDGEYELNVTIISMQPISYEFLTTFIVIEDQPSLHELFPIFFITLLPLFIAIVHKLKKR